MERESQLVERIARALSALAASNSGKKRAPRHLSAPSSQAGAALRLGIGDDAAVIAPSPRNEWAITCDAFLEGVHFFAKTHPPDSIGYKSLARATSDLAAMGATPRYFLLTLALPLKFSRAVESRQGTALAVPKSQNRFGTLGPELWFKYFLRGMARAARELGITIIGGDTTKSDRFFISITALGEIARGDALTRSGAKPGDLIYVSGKLGRAQLGLELVLRGLAGDPRFRALTQPHLYPKIRVALGDWLARQRIASSAMDISDGLSTDLARLCAASQVGAKIYANKIPTVTIPAFAAKKLAKRKLDPLQLALHGGEDYELLFTIPPRQANKIRQAPRAGALTAIGEITANKEIILVRSDGSHEPLKPGGWDPFRGL
jgi:thiamine-monophosphate kinase